MKQDAFDRRRFLAAALLAGGTLPVLSPRPAQGRALAGSKVVVVGAGVAGLAAARALADRGAAVTVLEARARIGGRVFTDRSLSVPFEVGAGWIHGPSPDNPVRKLADATGARRFVTADDSLAVFDAAGRRLGPDRVDAIDARWQRLLEQVDDALVADDPRSLRAAIAAVDPDALKDPGVLWALSAYTEFDSGAPIEDLSATLHDEDAAFDGADVVLPGGYDRILGPLADGLDVRLATPVTGIAISDDGARVRTAAGEVAADAVVCSVPLGVLKAGSIAFQPALPRGHRDAIRAIGFGSVTKIAFAFDAPFWDLETQYFGIMTAPKGRWNYWLNYRTFSDANVLLGVSVGAYAPVADRMADAAMADDALAVLRQVWGSAVGRPRRILTTHWSTDPHALGAYSYPRPGNRVSDFERLGEPVGGRLFFCGEHTLFDHHATVHGALLSGERAARQVLEKLG
ncbi:FAD-dependent oxidoreductase [Thalassobaculum sp.]|uniref:flavin monoamine oxidase family protein n=1 Tax=Thalassobaculum sp. TaxID=2022740 RepID=UPI0032EC3F11